MLVQYSPSESLLLSKFHLSSNFVASTENFVSIALNLYKLNFHYFDEDNLFWLSQILDEFFVYDMKCNNKITITFVKLTNLAVPIYYRIELALIFNINETLPDIYSFIWSFTVRISTEIMIHTQIMSNFMCNSLKKFIQNIVNYKEGNINKCEFHIKIKFEIPGQQKYHHVNS